MSGRRHFSDRLLVAEAAVTLALMHLAVSLISFRHIAPRLGRRDGADTVMLDAAQRLEVERIARAVTFPSRAQRLPTPWTRA